MWEITVHLAVAVAGGACGGVLLCCPFFPRDTLAEILDFIESISEGFPTYSHTASDLIFFVVHCDLFFMVQ